MEKDTSRKRVAGVSANVLVVPIVAVLSVLHILIIALIMMINNSSSAFSALMSSTDTYTQEATSILAGSSLLSETATNYVFLPLDEAGEINFHPLMAYASELGQERRGSQVLERFRGYDVDREVLSLIETAARSADQLLDAQLHAIALMNAVYPLPDTEPLTSIPQVALSETEKAMTDTQKEAAARGLVLGSSYGLNKDAVSKNINACVSLLQRRSAIASAEAGRRIAMLRTMLWVVTASIITILIFTFLTFYTQILSPIERFVALIPKNGALDEEKGFREVRLVAAAYNDAAHRRDALDQILRVAAETDALTNLPNRYRFEQYLMEAETSGYSIAILLFDINFLKKTNDTQGHLAGDRLIRTAAECISSVFGENCFRFGGDEFAAIVKDCTTDTISKMVERFEEAEKERHVSISIGCAYAEEIGCTTFRKLLDEADRKMYVQKKELHSRTERV